MSTTLAALRPDRARRWFRPLRLLTVAPLENATGWIIRYTDVSVIPNGHPRPCVSSRASEALPRRVILSERSE